MTSHAEPLRLGEFERTMAIITKQIDAGFAEVKDRQDVANGRLSKHDLRLAAIEWRERLVSHATQLLTHLGTLVGGGVLVYLLRHWLAHP